MKGLDPIGLRAGQIFFPRAFEQRAAAVASSTKFVHYTHARAATGILQSKKVWMRKSSCMNDFMEIEHGLECLVSAYKDEKEGKRFQAAINEIFDGISDEIAKLFDAWVPYLKTDTYLACVSEHNVSEDIYGRLSMWRAYGVGTGVAFILDSTPFLQPSDALKAYTYPVSYLSDTQFKDYFARIAGNIEKEKEFIRSLGRDAVKNYVFEIMRTSAICTKHPGFFEEEEWRVIYCPTLARSSHMEKAIEIIDGAPQPVYKIPLKNIPDEGFVGAEIPELVHRIIIGPTEYPSAMREAFVDLLAAAGVSDAEKRVSVSHIPLRR